MMWLEVLVEGVSDAPTVNAILQRKFALVEGRDYKIIWHTGRGSLPLNPKADADPKRTALLDQLPAKLRAYAKRAAPRPVVLVLVDVDKTPCHDLLTDLRSMLAKLDVHVEVMFRLAIKEMEGWFISDLNALRSAYPGRVEARILKGVEPDSVVDAWELLAKALRSDKSLVGAGVKIEWAERISPHLNLDNPRSPSLKKFIEGVARLVQARVV